MLLIENDGPKLIGSNYWDSEHARAGKLYVSINDRAFRILMPKSKEADVSEMLTAKLVVVSRGPWPAMRLPDAMEILFDDGTQSPFALHLSLESFDVLPAVSDDGRTDLLCLIYMAPGPDGVPRLAGTRPAAYRIVKQIPWMKAWGKT